MAGALAQNDGKSNTAVRVPAYSVCVHSYTSRRLCAEALGARHVSKPPRSTDEEPSPRHGNRESLQSQSDHHGWLMFVWPYLQNDTKRLQTCQHTLKEHRFTPIATQNMTAKLSHVFRSV